MKKLFTLTTLYLFSLGLQAQWLQQNSGFSAANRGIRDFSVVSPTVAWAVAYDGSGLNANVQDFTRTTNGGTTWTAGTITGTGITGFNNANISALDANTAWVALYGSAGGGRIYHTTNGGTTWTQQNTTGYTGAASFLNGVHFFDALNGVSIGDPEGGWHEVYTTQNGGTTWTRVPQAAMPAPLAADEYGVIDMFSTIGDTIWFGTVYGRVYRSTNKGLNWTAYTTGFTGNSVTYAMDDIEFLNGNDGLVKNGASLRRTTDGGLTWTAVPATGTVFTTDLGTVPGTPESYVSVGTTGSSYTQNAGNNWTTINTTQYNKVGFINPTTGWAGGFSSAGGTGGIFKWNGPTLLPTADLSISAVNSPATTLCNASAALVCVVITNTGTIPQANFPISYSINGGTPVTVTYTATVQPGANASYCFTPPVSLPAPGTYSVVASVNLTGDMDATNNQFTKTVNSITAAPITVTGAGAICAGQSATLSASGANTYTWQPGNLTGSSVTVSPTANTTYTVTGSTGTGCNATATAAVTLSAGPTITVTASPATVCNGQTANLTATGGVSYSWQNLGSGTTISVTPTATTTYAVTGTDANGCTGTANVTVNLSNGPALTVTAAPASVCPGEAVSLSASGGNTYSWHDAGQATATISINPTTSGTYTVTGTDAFGCTATANTSVSVTSAPVIAVTATQNTICDGQSLELTAAGGASYSWHDAGQTTSTLTVSPTTTSTYSVTTTTSSGCVGQGAITVSVNPAPAVAVTAQQTAICAGESVELTATAGLASYSWVPTATLPPVGQMITVSPQANTTYTLYGTNAQGCVGMATLPITVNSVPQIQLSPAQTLICEGISIGLTATGAQFSYSWVANPSIPLPPGSSIIVTPLTTTTFTVYGMDINQGCMGMASATVTVNPDPATPVITGPSLICNSDTVTLCITGTYPPTAQYSWSAPNAWSSSQQCTTFPGISQAYQGTVHGFVIVDGCISQAGIFQMTVSPQPQATIQNPVVNGNSVTVTAATAGTSTTYSWTFPNGTPPTANTQTATTTFANAGSYSVFLTTTGSNSCTNSDTLLVTISGTNEYLQSLVNIFPNPTNGVVQVDLTSLPAGPAEIRVTNVLGQDVKALKKVTDGVAELTLSDLPEGTYLLQITTSVGIISKPILLQK